MKLASSAVGAQDHRALVLTLLTLCNLTLAQTHAKPKPQTIALIQEIGVNRLE